MYALNKKSGAKISSFLRIADMYVPHHSSSIFVLGFLAITVVFGIFAGGHAYQAFNVTAAMAGFSVNKVNIIGNRQTSEIDIFSALSLDCGISLPGFDIEKARAAIAVFPWIESVSVQKIYPDQVNISVVERQPIAIWQHHGSVDIIDREGNIIVPYRRAFSRGLPLLVGQGAARQAAAFLKEIKPFSTIRQHARAYIRIGGRRWDILLDNGVRIKLPEKDVSRHLAAALMMQNRNSLFFRDVEIIDLRLDDRITVGLSAEALAHRAIAVKNLERQEKARKAG
ncbi:MAG: cell division protein FtsQ [Candidatus Tokpelaia sp. JSC189]|nr:MAG: cell division protein FtsQ [Candidatus Tokpelaia sp. JSC189]